MFYEKFSPSPELVPFIECYYLWEGDAASKLDVQSPPNSFGAIVFNYGAPYQAYQNNTPPLPVPMAFVCGVFTSNYHLVLHGKIHVAGIVLKTSSIHNFFGLRMSHLVNSRMPLSLLPAIDGEQIRIAVQSATSAVERVAILDNLMLGYVVKGKSNLSVIDEAVDYIDACKGRTTVEAVATHLKISRRYLEKRFLEKVGVSPKFYARIKRFGALSNLIAHNEKIDWQQIVTDYGFYDQSHLIKEFMEFNRMNPSDYHQLHQEMTRFLKR